jgi:hypothetical protein
VSAAGAATQPSGASQAQPDVSGRTVLAFLNEVAGGRRLLEAIRERVARGASSVALAAPQNQPAVGQIVDLDEGREAAQSRVEVTQGVLAEFGIEAEGAIFDPDPSLALDDAVRAFQPAEVLLSALAETRFGLLRRDLVEWARSHIDVPVTHIPVRIEDDAIRWDVTHTLVVATQTVASRELIETLLARARERPHRYTFICPRSGQMSRSEVSRALARTLATLYREDIDATGQPMSPEPFAAVRNAIEHYRVDDILISTLSGEQSKWLEEGLIERVREITDKPIEHIEASRPGEETSRPDEETSRPGEETEAVAARAEGRS